MERISFSTHHLKEPVEDAPRSERAELIGKFLEKMNVGRNGQEIVWNGRKIKLRPYTASGIGNKLRFLETKALAAFYGECSAAKNFQTYFNWKFKIAKESKK